MKSTRLYFCPRLEASQLTVTPLHSDLSGPQTPTLVKFECDFELYFSPVLRILYANLVISSHFRPIFAHSDISFELSEQLKFFGFSPDSAILGQFGHFWSVLGYFGPFLVDF